MFAISVNVSCLISSTMIWTKLFILPGKTFSEVIDCLHGRILALFLSSCPSNEINQSKKVVLENIYTEVAMTLFRSHWIYQLVQIFNHPVPQCVKLSELRLCRLQLYSLELFKKVFFIFFRFITTNFSSWAYQYFFFVFYKWNKMVF